MTSANPVLDLSYTDIRGHKVDLGQFTGKPVLIVNTASKCGLTPQYEGLQKLQDEFADSGLVIIGFPCNQFAGQEPGDESAVAEFCQLNYGVTFRLSEKIDVNGKNTHPIFKSLKKQTGGLFGGTIKWNFTKFLILPDGSVKRYAPTVTPEAMHDDIRKSLS